MGASPGVRKAPLYSEVRGGIPSTPSLSSSFLPTFQAACLNLTMEKWRITYLIWPPKTDQVAHGDL